MNTMNLPGETIGSARSCVPMSIDFSEGPSYHTDFHEGISRACDTPEGVGAGGQSEGSRKSRNGQHNWDDVRREMTLTNEGRL